MESQAIDLGFMLFGLAFFLFVINFIRQSSDVDYQRRTNDRREFGHDKPQKRRFLRSD